MTQFGKGPMGEGVVDWSNTFAAVTTDDLSNVLVSFGKTHSDQL